MGSIEGKAMVLKSGKELLDHAREGWTRFFLSGVAETAQEEAPSIAEAIIRLRDENRTLMQDHGLGINGLKMLDLMF